MFSLSEHFNLSYLTEDNPIKDFTCENKDLDEFFCEDAILYQKQLLGQTYFFKVKTNNEIACAFTLSNDSIKVLDLPNSRQKKVRENIPHAKSMKSYPATLIGRFGVAAKFKGKGIGCKVMDFIKSTCITEDANKCRFLIVDSYNTEDARGFYLKNEFTFLFSSEEQEKVYYEIENDKPLNSRFMYFDLLPWMLK